MNFSFSAAEIDPVVLRREVIDEASGACVVFEGWVRNHHEGRAVMRLEYEVYEPVALKVGRQILEEAREQFGPLYAAAVHRYGLMEVGEVAVAVAVSSAHRDEGFKACRYIIDEAKTRLPIWKKEYFADGSVQWVNCARCAGHAHGGGAV